MFALLGAVALLRVASHGKTPNFRPSSEAAFSADLPILVRPITINWQGGFTKQGDLASIPFMKRSGHTK